MNNDVKSIRTANDLAAGPQYTGHAPSCPGNMAGPSAP
jgi:hypothetical protein